MITKTKAYTTSDKMTFATIDDAKQHELEIRLIPESAGPESGAADIAEAISKMVADPESFITILKAREPKKRGPKKAKAAKPAAKAA